MPKGSRRRPGTIGANLRRLRERAGLTQRALADASGVHYVSIGRLESGERQSASPKTIGMLAKALGVRANELMEPGNGSGFVAVEPALEEMRRSEYWALIEPTDDELRWLRSLPGLFWLDSPPTSASLALLIQSHRKRRK